MIEAFYSLVSDESRVTCIGMEQCREVEHQADAIATWLYCLSTCTLSNTYVYRQIHTHTTTLYTPMVLRFFLPCIGGADLFDNTITYYCKYIPDNGKAT